MIGAKRDKRDVRTQAQPSTWLVSLRASEPPMLMSIALANKMARIIWAQLKIELWPRRRKPFAS